MWIGELGSLCLTLTAESMNAFEDQTPFLGLLNIWYFTIFYKTELMILIKNILGFFSLFFLHLLNV